MTGLTNAPEQVDDVDTHAAAHYAGGADPIDLAKLGAIPALEKGKAGGVATLGTDGKVPGEQLPTFDVIGQFQSHNADKTAHGDIRILASNAQTAADEAKAAAETAQAQVAKAAAWELIDKIDNTVGYSGEWRAPDVFGDGSAYDLGVYMIGGGGSGGFFLYSYASSSMTGTNPRAGVTGGASGYGKNFVLSGVEPGTLYNWVVGVGGASYTHKSSSSHKRNGVAGGTTSFAGQTANGGGAGKANEYYSNGWGTESTAGASGGQGSDPALYSRSPHKLYGCIPTIDYCGKGGASQNPRDGQNWFDQTMITLSAGGSSYLNSSSTNPEGGQKIIAMPDGTKGGDCYAMRELDATAESATGYGNGGGGVIIYTGGASLTATSGAGSDGVIFLYARKAVSE